MKCILRFVLQEPRRVPPSRRRRKKIKSCFPAACTSENTLLRPQVCERKRVRAADCIPLEKMLAFLRSVSKYFDTLCDPGKKGAPLPSFGSRNALVLDSCTSLPAPEGPSCPSYHIRPSLARGRGKESRPSSTAHWALSSR